MMIGRDWPRTNTHVRSIFCLDLCLDRECISCMFYSLSKYALISMGFFSTTARNNGLMASKNILYIYLSIYSVYNPPVGPLLISLILALWLLRNEQANVVTYVSSRLSMPENYLVNSNLLHHPLQIINDIRHQWNRLGIHMAAPLLRNGDMMPLAKTRG